MGNLNFIFTMGVRAIQILFPVLPSQFEHLALGCLCLNGAVNALTYLGQNRSLRLRRMQRRREPNTVNSSFNVNFCANVDVYQVLLASHFDLDASSDEQPVLPEAVRDVSDSTPAC